MRARSSPGPAGPGHLRHRQVRHPVTYAIDMPYRCRWRSRQVPFGVAGVADSLRSGHDLPAPRPGIDTPSSSSPRPTSRPAHGSSWELRVAERPQVHTLTPAAGKRRPQRHTITVIGYRAPGAAALSRDLLPRARRPRTRSPSSGEEQPAQPRETPASARRRAPKAVSEPPPARPATPAQASRCLRQSPLNVTQPGRVALLPESAWIPRGIASGIAFSRQPLIVRLRAIAGQAIQRPISAGSLRGQTAPITDLISSGSG